MGVGSIGSGALALLALAAGPGWAQTAPAAGATPEGTPAATPAGTPAAAPGPNAREQQLLERIRQLKAPRWRSYGVCRYDWSAWRLTEGAVRTTDVECGPDNGRALVAVHCDTLQVSRREGDAAWSPWRLPLSPAESKTSGGEDLMVAALCANLKPSAPGPSATGAPVPLTTAPTPGAAKPATAKPAAAKPATPKPATPKPGAAKPAGNR